jgi:hypothetical protein
MVVEGERSYNCGGMAVAPPKFGRENGYMRRILEGKQNKWRELPFLWPTPRARSTFRAFLFRSESLTAPRKAEDGLGSPDGLRAYSEGKRGTGGTAGPNNAVRIKKRAAGSLVGETARDAPKSSAHRATLASEASSSEASI